MPPVIYAADQPVLRPSAWQKTSWAKNGTFQAGHPSWGHIDLTSDWDDLQYLGFYYDFIQAQKKGRSLINLTVPSIGEKYQSINWHYHYAWLTPSKKIPIEVPSGGYEITYAIGHDPYFKNTYRDFMSGKDIFINNGGYWVKYFEHNAGDYRTEWYRNLFLTLLKNDVGWGGSSMPTFYPSGKPLIDFTGFESVMSGAAMLYIQSLFNPIGNIIDTTIDTTTDTTTDTTITDVIDEVLPFNLSSILVWALLLLMEE